MNAPLRRLLPAVTLLATATAVAGVLVGCQSDAKDAAKPKVAEKYEVLGPRPVPEWMKGSIMEQCDLASIAPFRVNNFGLVVMKQPTGDAVSAPNQVREYMIREMVKRGFGSKNMPGFEKTSPDQVLRDPRVAIVRVEAFIPAGASKGQRIDAQVSVLDNSNATSLAGGMLFTTDLMPNGADFANPGSAIDVLATSRGYVFVNPAYALETNPDDPAQRRALTNATILAGARLAKDRPFGLRIRAAEKRMSRLTEYRIDQLCANADAAAAHDEGMVFVNVPASYRGDWEHFAGVVLHTFYDASTPFAVAKAKQLAEEAVKPDALLLDISYAWEALGQPALPYIEPLLTNANPDVAFAAARAAAFIGSGAAEATLLEIARDPNNPRRINAVQTLGLLPATPAINMLLRSLLNVEEPTVRVEAYKGLTRNLDTGIFSKMVGDKFFLDIVPSEGPPMIYASRSGFPRIAFIGATARLPAPTFFAAMNNEFSISPVEQRNNLLTLYYRGPGVSEPVKQLTTPDLAEIVARLGGEGPPGTVKLDFSYGEIVAMLAKMADQSMLVASRNNSAPEPVAFMLQEPPAAQRDIDTAPIIPEGPRPIGAADASTATTPTIPTP